MRYKKSRRIQYCKYDEYIYFARYRLGLKYVLLTIICLRFMGGSNQAGVSAAEL